MTTRAIHRSPSVNLVPGADQTEQVAELLRLGRLATIYVSGT